MEPDQLNFTPPYEPGSLPMPELPYGYVAPIPIADDPSIPPEGDVERLVGGDFYCKTYQERDLIPAIYRRVGITLAYVENGSGEHPGDTFWYLRGGITNDCWVPQTDAGRGATGSPSIIRGGTSDPMNFPPSARFVLY